ncbi:major facilitator superfamily domain-containing protein [Talaromyces proteolyticus]|uniref:Major facilitator superfamily domain-containing protein n=1 Tax=Talaromyces proteolyticus TaxID=1131652 RepID=A0AAD4KNA5_9EURO|nr:major facilitator superfamily domain-containing protein [Talaromyces proteolyticus]KAH8692312.1 major facilitator superfamily domain-containing protein [Talaromyces proteolyticus]
MSLSSPKEAAPASLDDAESLSIEKVKEQGSPEPPDLSVPNFPDGGTKAWLVVLGAWCTSFASFGIVNSFGIYETHYIQTYLSSYPQSTIAWIGSVQAFAQFSATLISGPITDRYGPMVVIWPCSLLLVVAMMLTSLCTEFYQFLLCQGILLGSCCGLIFAPAISVVAHYFMKKRAMAMAFASTGSPIGGTIFPIILTRLIQIPSVGFPWAQRVCGFLSLFLLIIAAVTIRPTPFRRKGPFILLEAFKIPAYCFQVAGLFFIILGFWTPYFYLAEYGLAHGMSNTLASYLFALINAGSFVGRMLGGTISMYIGQFNVLTAACFSSALMLYCWLKVTSSAGLVVLSLFFGGTSGIIIALMMSTLAHCAPHPSKIGTYAGQSTFIIGFAGLAGTPITGALISNNGYNAGILFSASVFMAGSVIFSFARYYFAKDKFIA